MENFEKINHLISINYDNLKVRLKKEYSNLEVGAMYDENGNMTDEITIEVSGEDPCPSFKLSDVEAAIYWFKKEIAGKY